MDAEGGLAENSADNEIPVMDTGLDRQVPTPEVNDNYVNSLVMLPRGNTCVRGKVIRQKIDSSGNAVGRVNNNPIFHTHEYRVKFGDGEVRKLIKNVIVESMYAACGDSCNDYLLMGSIFD